MPITKTLTVNETKTEETTFQESSATTVKHTGSVDVGISIKIVKIGGSYTFESSNTQTVAYGTKSTITRGISDQTTVTIPAQTKGVIDYQSIKHSLDVNYKIVFKGVKCPKLIEMRGTWKGVDYTTDHFIVKEYDLVSKALKNTRVINSSKR